MTCFQSNFCYILTHSLVLCNHSVAIRLEFRSVFQITPLLFVQQWGFMPLKGLLLVSFAHEIGRGLVFEYEYDVVSVYAVKIKIMLAAQEFLCRNAEFYLFIVRLDIEGFFN